MVTFRLATFLAAFNFRSSKRCIDGLPEIARLVKLVSTGVVLTKPYYVRMGVQMLGTGLQSMVDWLSVLDSNLGGLLLSGIVGVLLASFIQYLTSARANSTRVNQVALLLGYEIAHMREIATASGEAYLKPFSEYKSRASKGVTTFPGFEDPDISHAVYDKPTTDLSLFPKKTVPVVVAVYQLLEICVQLKSLANVESQKAKNSSERFEITGNPEDQKESVNRVRRFINYGEAYLEDLAKFVVLCDSAIAELSKISQIDKSKVSSIDPKVERLSP